MSREYLSYLNTGEHKRWHLQQSTVLKLYELLPNERELIHNGYFVNTILFDGEGDLIHTPVFIIVSGGSILSKYTAHKKENGVVSADGVFFPYGGQEKQYSLLLEPELNIDQTTIMKLTEDPWCFLKIDVSALFVYPPSKKQKAKSQRVLYDSIFTNKAI